MTNLIAGVTFQLLAPSAQESDGSLEQIQLVIGNDNTDVASTINTMVSDYNSLVSAMNVQEGNDSSGNPEPLFGSPTLSLLQQQLLGGLNIQNPNGYMDSVATNTDTTLAGSISIAVGTGTTQTIVIGSAPSNPPADTYYTGSGSDSNTIQGLADAINAAAAGTNMTYTGTAGTDTVASTGTLTGIPDLSLPLSGSISIQVGSGTAETHRRRRRARNRSRRQYHLYGRRRLHARGPQGCDHQRQHRSLGQREHAHGRPVDSLFHLRNAWNCRKFDHNLLARRRRHRRRSQRRDQ